MASSGKLDRAEAVIAFIETLRCPDGTKAGTPFRLRDWQKKIIRAVYGNVGADGLRIVRQAILSIPRKNGKTALVAGLCLAHLCGPEAIRNGQLYSLSIDREQAAILFNYAAAMVYMDEELNSRLNVIESRKQIVDPVSGSRYVVLSGEKKGKMGKSSSVIFFDELAEFDNDRELYDALMTSRGAHEEPLVWVFSTQAKNDTALLSELIDRCLKAKEDGREDPTFRLFLYSAPIDADPWDEKTWFDCNPALGDFKNLEVMREEAHTAKLMPSAEGAFRNLHLNQRIDAGDVLIPKTVWEANGAEPDEDAFYENPIVAGLDLSRKNDLSALIFTAKGNDGFTNVRPYFWVPEDGLAEKARKDKAPYIEWRDKGYLEAVPGPVINYRWIAVKLKEINDDTEQQIYVFFDRWKMNDLIPYLQEENVPYVIAEWQKDEKTKSRTLNIPDHELNTIVFVPHGQGFQDMDPAVTLLEDALLKKEIRHGMNPVLTMCAANVKVTIDPAGNRKFDKMKSTGRIDGIVGLGMALHGISKLVTMANNTVSSYFETHSFF